MVRLKQKAEKICCHQKLIFCKSEAQEEFIIFSQNPQISSSRFRFRISKSSGSPQGASSEFQLGVQADSCSSFLLFSEESWLESKMKSLNLLSVNGRGYLQFRITILNISASLTMKIKGWEQRNRFGKV